MQRSTALQPDKSLVCNNGGLKGEGKRRAKLRRAETDTHHPSAQDEPPIVLTSLRRRVCGGRSRSIMFGRDGKCLIV
jgi:hypothetical protein